MTSFIIQPLEAFNFSSPNEWLKLTPLKNEYSPAEQLMGRRLKSSIPLCSSKLTPQSADQDSLRNFEERYRQRQSNDFDRRHGVHDLPELLYGGAVWVTDFKSKGTIQAPADEPRFFCVNTDTGAVCRTRRS
ncbi:hypothetical protein MRX96_004793 [Rhipicephalus microplus]